MKTTFLKHFKNWMFWIVGMIILMGHRGLLEKVVSQEANPNIFSALSIFCCFLSVTLFFVQSRVISKTKDIESGRNVLSKKHRMLLFILAGVSVVIGVMLAIAILSNPDLLK